MKLEGTTIICDQEELNLIRKALDYYTQNVMYRKIEIIKDPDHPFVIDTVKYEELCQSLNISGYEFT